MTRIQFYGQVHPTTIPITINDYTINYRDNQLGELSLVIRIQDGDVEVHCILEQQLSEIASAAFFRVLQLTQSLVDLAGFAVGAGLEVIFNEATVEGQPRGWIEYRQENLAKINSVISLHDKSFNTLFDILCQQPLVLFALHDLKLALTHKIQQATHCARAIEGLRSYFGSDDKRKAEWKLMQDNLNVTQSP
jgi:hypothetical protein